MEQGMIIRLDDVFTSFDGECNGFHQGAVTTFIRFQGCNLRCWYCDTERTQKIEEAPLFLTPQEIAECVKTKKVTITGGEPLLQSEGLIELVGILLSQGKNISIETNGTQEIPKVLRGRHKRLSWVVDFKMTLLLSTPCFEDSFRTNVLPHLCRNDFVKVPVTNTMFETLVLFLEHTPLVKEKRWFDPVFAISPISGKGAVPFDYEFALKTMVERQDLFEGWILNAQIHKFIGVA
jgi:organic radical activating enzyme